MYRERVEDDVLGRGCTNNEPTGPGRASTSSAVRDG